MVVENRVLFLVESELFRGQVRYRPVEKCSPRWSRKQGQLVRMVIYWNMFLSYVISMSFLAQNHMMIYNSKITW